MTLAKHNEILDWFRQEGNKVLITTPVLEEGINVTSCELVVRYTPAKTSTEFKQSKGRARKAGARFVTIIEKGSGERAIIQKCEKELMESQMAKDRLSSALLL